LRFLLKKAAADAQTAAVVSPDTPNVIQTMMQVRQVKTRAEAANKVVLEAEKAHENSKGHDQEDTTTNISLCPCLSFKQTLRRWGDYKSQKTLLENIQSKTYTITSTSVRALLFNSAVICVSLNLFRLLYEHTKN
jgi:PAB1-binding protein PBP1